VGGFEPPTLEEGSLEGEACSITLNNFEQRQGHVCGKCKVLENYAIAGGHPRPISSLLADIDDYKKSSWSGVRDNVKATRKQEL